MTEMAAFAFVWVALGCAPGVSSDTAADAEPPQPDGSISNTPDALPVVDAGTAPSDATPGLADAVPAMADAAPSADASVVAPNGVSDSFTTAVTDVLTTPGLWNVLYADRAASARVAAGRLDIVAFNSETVGAHNGWFQDDHGPLLYQNVTGNFAVAARLRVVDEADPGQPPVGNFKAGGFVIRDPAGTHSGDENWIMYNMGFNQGAYRREAKKTTSSVSGLYLNPQTFTESALLVCRVAGRFYFHAWNTGTQTWVAERFQPGTTLHHVAVVPEVDTSGASPIHFNDQLPDAVQVGVMSHAWEYAGNGSRTLASYDWVEFAIQPPAAVSECTSGFSPLDLP